MSRSPRRFSLRNSLSGEPLDVPFTESVRLLRRRVCDVKKHPFATIEQRGETLEDDAILAPESTFYTLRAAPEGPTPTARIVMELLDGDEPENLRDYHARRLMEDIGAERFPCWLGIQFLNMTRYLRTMNGQIGPKALKELLCVWWPSFTGVYNSTNYRPPSLRHLYEACKREIAMV